MITDVDVSSLLYRVEIKFSVLYEEILFVQLCLDGHYCMKGSITIYQKYTVFGMPPLANGLRDLPMSLRGDFPTFHFKFIFTIALEYIYKIVIKFTNNSYGIAFENQNKTEFLRKLVEKVIKMVK